MGSSVWWKCEKGHEWEARIANRCKRKKPSPCPECRLGQQRYLRDHTAADQWNVAKNGSIKDETCGLRRLVWWECDQGHEWQTSIHSRCRGKKPSPCPKCRLGQQRYLRDHAVADQWNVAKNGPIGEITCGSGKRVLWKCDQGHEWEARIYDRCKKETPSSCPKCESRQIRYLRDHAAADQWDVAKNGLLENQTCGMGSSVWWRCEKGHEWEASIHNRCREKKPSACPECKTKKKKRAAEEPLEDQPAQKRQREENSE
ncbi:MAG: hypothetical protein SP1CHLAM42_04580 [Chlamydiales bacterium]|nr:hypothetical protein [Chlamydiales bacterium]